MKRLQCKDIPTLPILEHVKKHGGIGCTWYFKDERNVTRAMPPGLPEKLILAKMRNLMIKGLIDGCSCGCRGDYKITEEGWKRILVLKGVWDG